MVGKRHSSTFSLSPTMMFVVKGQDQGADFAILVLITLIADRSLALLCLASIDRCPTQLRRRGTLHKSLPSDSSLSWPLIRPIATALPMSHPSALTRVTSQPLLCPAQLLISWLRAASLSSFSEWSTRYFTTDFFTRADPMKFVPPTAACLFHPAGLGRCATE